MEETKNIFVLIFNGIKYIVSKSLFYINIFEIKEYLINYILKDVLDMIFKGIIKEIFKGISNKIV